MSDAGNNQPPRLAEGTAPGTATVVGARCAVTYPERLGRAEVLVWQVRVGRVARLLLDGRVEVALYCGQHVVVPARDVEVFA